MKKTSTNWPALDYQKFKSTRHLLHMGTQAIGKLKLITPFEPHWANVALWLTSRGLTTGLILYNSNNFSVDLDLIDHRIAVTDSTGAYNSFNIDSMSVAQFTDKLFSILQKMKIDIPINLMPQEIENPIPFDKDTQQQFYDKELANMWWRILVNSYQVMQRYHSRFDGETPPIGLMWGTFDLRDARYSGNPVPTTGPNAGYIRRNAMNEEQVEIGWWPGNEMYPQPAYFSFTYPAPDGIANAKIKPERAHWDQNLSEFILNYADLIQESNPEKTLLEFFESTYKVGSELAGWNPKFNTSGKPV